MYSSLSVEYAEFVQVVLLVFYFVSLRFLTLVQLTMQRTRTRFSAWLSLKRIYRSVLYSVHMEEEVLKL